MSVKQFAAEMKATIEDIKAKGTAAAGLAPMGPAPPEPSRHRSTACRRGLTGERLAQFEVRHGYSLSAGSVCSV